MTSEATVQQRIRLLAPYHGVTLWRNNSGAFFDAHGRMVRYGLGNDSAKLNDAVKSSDLIGITAAGVFIAIECKAPGWRLLPGDERGHAQLKFLKIVRSHGGFAGFATCPDDFLRILAGVNRL